MRAWVAVLVVAGCTGLTLGENSPGGDTYLEFGSIAVDPDTETSFVMPTTLNATGTDTYTRRQLWAVPPESGEARYVMDLADTGDVRLLFPETSLLVMADTNPGERLTLLDKTTFAVKQIANVSARYHGTRTSPSRRWVAVADNDDPAGHAPIDVIDTRDLSIHRLTHDGDWLEAMWLHGDDRLVAIVFYETGTEGAHARLLSWRMTNVTTSTGFGDGRGPWPAPDVDLPLPGVDADLFFSFTWVGVSPDDRTLVLPVRHAGAAGAAFLLVLDLEDGALRTVENALGPVGFTPDGSTIISYRYEEHEEGTAGRADILAVDREDLSVEVVPLPYDVNLPSFFVSHDGNVVVVVSALGTARLVLYDLDTGMMTRLIGPRVALYELVSRLGHDEVWLVDDKSVYRLDLAAMRMDLMPLVFSPAHINILRTHDRLVLDDIYAPVIHFVDPVTGLPTRSVTLPAF